MDLFFAWLLRMLLFQLPGVRIVRTVLVLVLSFQIFVYLFAANGLFTMARRRNIRGAWTAWVPGLQAYAMGAVADYRSGSHFLTVFLPCLLAAAGACTVFSKTAPAVRILGIVLTITLVIFYFLALARILEQYMKHPGGLVALSVIVYFLGPVFLFRFRTKPLLEEKAIAVK